MFWFFYCLVKLFYMLFKPAKVYGRENLAVKGGVIYCINHRRASDPLEVGIKIPRWVHFMSKKELFKKGFLNWFFLKMGMFPVERGKADIVSIRRCVSLLQEGKAVGIFPEGTRHPESFDVCELQNGAAMTAIRANVPIVPIFMDAKPRLFTRTRIYAGEPLTFSVKKLDTVACNAATKQLYDAMQALAETAKRDSK